MNEAAMSIRIFIKHEKFSLQVFRIDAANTYGLIFERTFWLKLLKST